MALARALTEARRQTATRENRQRQMRAEVRLEEIVKVAGIADDYMNIDREGDLNVETHFGRLYHAAESEYMRTLITSAFVAWQRDEKAEEQMVLGSVDDSVTVLKANNPIWLDGSAVPSGSDGAA